MLFLDRIVPLSLVFLNERVSLCVVGINHSVDHLVMKFHGLVVGDLESVLNLVQLFSNRRNIIHQILRNLRFLSFFLCLLNYFILLCKEHLPVDVGFDHSSLFSGLNDSVLGFHELPLAILSQFNLSPVLCHLLGIDLLLKLPLLLVVLNCVSNSIASNAVVIQIG